jgi:hypothetical protein
MRPGNLGCRNRFWVQRYIPVWADDLKSLSLYLFGSLRVNQKRGVALRLSQATSKIPSNSPSADDQNLHRRKKGGFRIRCSGGRNNLRGEEELRKRNRGSDVL